MVDYCPLISSHLRNIICLSCSDVFCQQWSFYLLQMGAGPAAVQGHQNKYWLICPQPMQSRPISNTWDIREHYKPVLTQLWIVFLIVVNMERIWCQLIVQFTGLESGSISWADLNVEITVENTDGYSYLCLSERCRLWGHHEVTAASYWWLTFPVAMHVMASIKTELVIWGQPDTNLSLGYRIHTPLLRLIENIGLTEHT